MSCKIIACSESSQVDHLASTLASAFLHDPVLRHIVDPLPANDTLYILYKGWLSQNIRQSRSKGVIHATQDLSCVAMWAEPGYHRMSLITRFFTSIYMRFLLGTRASAMLTFLDATERQHPTEPHVYLQVLGTHQNYQGNGLGARVIHEMLADCDRKGVPAYTESSNPRNVPFYQRQGFQVIGMVKGLPDGFPPLTRLWRPPKMDNN